MPDWDPQANDLFLRALDIPAPEDRLRFLDAACAGDPALRARVDGLLRAGAAAGSFLEHPVDQGVTCVHVAAPGDQPGAAPVGPGTIIGPYKLVEEIGEGGMGTVYLAQQTEPVRRLVAVKLVKPGMDSKSVLARFDAERQALALMDHPNIAKVLDAGATPDGRPYFVMELVKGTPITSYCDERRLGVRDRLALFADVCRAVQHAHQKGIIHRDIKPSNVLVAPYDGKPVVKVIDFGVAKAAGQPLTERTLVTGLGAVVGTPEYMSPEQAELNNADIDTRSDIYALGVLLYELLTGTTPLTRKRLKDAALLEVLRVIREEEPPRPSTRLSTTAELPSIAAVRGVDPARLSKLVRGELDWIVMRALEKDRTRRYETALGFAADVEHYLADEPVQACPPSARYRLRKFLRRNTVALTAGGLVALALVFGTAISVWQAVRATSAEARTREALDEAVAAKARTDGALAAETAARADEATANVRTREMLDALTDDVVKTMFVRQPELDEQEKAFLGKILGFYESVTRRSGGTVDERFLRARGYFTVAYIRQLLGAGAEAEAGYRRAAVLLRELVEECLTVPEYRQKLAMTDNRLGAVLVESGRDAEAETVFRQGVAIYQKLADEFPNVGPYRRELAAALNDLAYALKRQQKPAEPTYRQAVAEMEAVAARADAVPTDHRLLARTRSHLGMLLREEHKYTEAEELYQRAVSVHEQYQLGSPTTPVLRRELADARHGQAILLAELKKTEGAEAAFKGALDLRRKLVEAYPGTAQYRRELARTCLDYGILLSLLDRLDDAEANWDEARNLCERLVRDAPNNPESHNELAETLGRLAGVRLRQKDLAGAVALLERARPHHQTALRVAPSPAYHRAQHLTLATLAFTRAQLTDHVRLAAAADELAGIRYDPVNDYFNAASCLCRCVALAERDMQLTEPQRRELVQKYTDRALALLQDAVAHGYKNLAQLKHPAFAILRERAEFKKILADLAKKID
jgi:serine/threonine protein kinase